MGKGYLGVEEGIWVMGNRVTSIEVEGLTRIGHKALRIGISCFSSGFLDIPSIS